MRHRATALLLVLAAAFAASGASAQVAYNTPGRSGLGGGFIEFLVTGSASGRQQPAPGGARAYPGRAPAPVAFDPSYGADPFAEPQPVSGRRRLAALPTDPDDGSLGMAPAARYQRQEVAWDGPEGPGTIVVDTPAKFLYHVLPGGRAMRYGIGVGRPGFEWSGIKSVTMKKEWPSWTPPAEMLKRRPDLPRHMAGGPANPLGARALYLGSSLYRIHGTNEPHTIGRNVSSGCIRMMNEDVIHLYDRVGVGARVKVI
jgi:lipoprotein-anchoring transpeptidase ErfK/SrfK